MVAKYSQGTPKDWVERFIYSKHSAKGIALMFGLDIFLFGIPGITIWAIQMLWIPFFAAGVVNGLGHHWGYRNFECRDAATNLFPWGFWIGGEELHNNHHTFASSAKFSVKWWEFDLGWMYIRILSFFGLAKVKKIPPKLGRDEAKQQVDLDTVKAVIANRFQIMSTYYKTVIRPMVAVEKEAHPKSARLFQRAASLLKCEDSLLTSKAKQKLQVLLTSCEKLRLVYTYKQSLQNVWLRTASSQKELIEALQQWCKQAEESGLEVLRQFSVQLKGYVPV